MQGLTAHMSGGSNAAWKILPSKRWIGWLRRSKFLLLSFSWCLNQMKSLRRRLEEAGRSVSGNERLLLIRTHA